MSKELLNAPDCPFCGLKFAFQEIHLSPCRDNPDPVRYQPKIRGYQPDRKTSATTDLGKRVRT